jgi:oxygen-independent coproporphyrinogen-3 oxidase
MEVNPEDVDKTSLSDWKSLGVSYLSLGAQSFDPQALEFLGRHHTPIQARESILMAKEAAFHTVSIDLIYCLPGQTEEAWRSELASAAETETDHISCYQLTIEPDTPFGVRKRQGRLDEPDEGVQASLFFETHDCLESLGYTAYEVSNFASADQHRSRHNQKYWTQKPYLGLGPSAHSFSGSFRWWNRSRLTEYLDSIGHRKRPISETEQLNAKQRCLEIFALGLRTPEGVDLADLPAGLGAEILDANQTELNRWTEAGLVEAETMRIRPTLKGMALADTLSRKLHIPIA